METLLASLDLHEAALGSRLHFPPPDKPFIAKKVKRAEYQVSYSDYEHRYLLVLGFFAIEKNKEELVAQNNRREFPHNPATLLLERVSGLTMHGDREGVNYLIGNAVAIITNAFNAHPNKLHFWQTAFDRLADPCFEGICSRLLQFTETYSPHNNGGGNNAWAAPAQDVTLDLAPFKHSKDDVKAKEIVGECLRVFTNVQTQEYAKRMNISFVDAVAAVGSMDGDSHLVTDKTFKPWLLQQLRQNGYDIVVSDKAADEAIRYYIDLCTLNEDNNNNDNNNNNNGSNDDGKRKKRKPAVRAAASSTTRSAKKKKAN